MAERAGTELHAPAVPGHDVAIGDQLCGSVNGFPERAVARDLDPIGEGAKRALDLAAPMGGAVERRGGSAVGHLAERRCPLQRRAERRSVIGGRWLNVDLIEAAGLDQSRVGGRIQRYTPREGQPTEFEPPAEVSAEMEHRPIQAGLECGGGVLMLAGDLGAGRARREQPLAQVTPRCGVPFALRSRLLEPQQWDFPAAIFFEPDRLIEEGSEALGVPVGRQAHHLVLVGVEVEPEVQRDERVEDADRVRRRDPVGGRSRPCLAR